MKQMKEEMVNLLVKFMDQNFKDSTSISDRVYSTNHVQLYKLLYRNKFILMTDKKINCINRKSL